MVYVDKIRNNAGKKLKLDVLGLFSGTHRRIQVKTGLHPTQERHTLFHEWVHLVLWDSGLSNIFSAEQQEAICDALASALVVSHYNP